MGFLIPRTDVFLNEYFLINGPNCEVQDSICLFIGHIEVILLPEAVFY